MSDNKLALKKGDYIQITLKGTVEYDVVEDDDGLIDIAVLWEGINNPMDYTDISDIPASAIEVIVPPRAEGLYYDGPIPTDYCPQASAVYKFQYETWYNWRGDAIHLSEERIARLTPLAVNQSGQ